MGVLITGASGVGKSELALELISRGSGLIADDVVEFYKDGVGLVELGRFDGHSGYDGVMLGLPGSDYHLEFTSHADGSPTCARAGSAICQTGRDGPRTPASPVCPRRTSSSRWRTSELAVARARSRGWDRPR